MEISFLGTSAGCPTKRRNVSAITLTEPQGKGWYLIDCGEGTQQQIMRSHLKLSQLKVIFITHVHGDHCYGLPGLLSSAAMQGRTKPMLIVAPLAIQQWLDVTQSLTDFYLPYSIDFIDVETLIDFETDYFTVSAKPLVHRVPSYGYQFQERALTAPDQPLRSLIICGDNAEPQVLAKKGEDSTKLGINLLVHEATYSKEKADRAQQFAHSYAEQVALFAEQQQIPHLILTHFSSRYSKDMLKGFIDESQAVYSGAVHLAEDFARYQLQRNGQLKVIS